MNVIRTTLTLMVVSWILLIPATGKEENKEIRLEQDPIGEQVVTRSFDTPARPARSENEAVLRQAFFGAPPLMPHIGMTENNADLCLQCHAKENRIEYRHQAIAPVPHEEFSQCLQCHLAADKSIAPFVENSFAGLDKPGKGSRAHPFAPPTVPHRLFMRDNCLSCHGATGKSPIKSPHPVRSQCLQCHVPELSVDFSRPMPE